MHPCEDAGGASGWDRSQHRLPRYERPPRPSKLKPFKDEIHAFLRKDPNLSSVRVRELIEPLGFDGSETIIDDYLRDGWPLFRPRGPTQRTVYRPGEICQFDTSESLRRRCRSATARPEGVGRRRLSRYSPAGAGALIYCKEAPDAL